MLAENRAVSRVVRTTFDEEEVIAVVRECRDELDANPTIVFAFVSSDWRPHLRDFLEIIQVHGRAVQIVGSSADGLIGVGQEDENVSGFSVLFLHLPNTEVRSIEISEDDLADATGPAEWERLTGLPKGQGQGWVMLCNPINMRTESWLRIWNSIYPDVPVYGGLASGDGQEEDFFLIHGSKLSKAAMVGVHFSGGIRLGGVVSQGCRPIGEPYTITEVDENVLVTVGQRRAFEVLEEAFDSLAESEQEGAQGNIFAGLAISEYIEEFRRGDFLVRNILGVDPQAGVLALGAFPRVGQTVQFQLRDRDTADEDLREQCIQAQQELGQPFGGLLFSCSGRGSRLFGVPDHDAGILEDVFGRIPVGGFFCNGEIGPVGGQNFIHGYTASAVFFLNA